MDRIAQTVRPTPQQQAAFESLKSASASAAAALQASCPATAPATPVDRIDAVAMRLDGMLQAAKSVRPALGAFYAALSDEQKARFMGAKTIEVKASHLSLISHPDEITRLILEAAGQPG